MRSKDPLLATGHLTCSRCAAVSYPSQATWLDDSKVLALFPAPCEHVSEAIRLVTPSALPADRRCQGVTLTGQRCRNAVTTEGWCVQHDPGSDRHGGVREVDGS